MAAMNEIPARIYHYTSRETALEYILPTMSLRLGSLGQTNDPRETREWSFPAVSGDPDAPGASAEDFLKSGLMQIDPVINAIRNREWWVLCVCKDDADLQEPGPDQADFTHFKRGYARPRMWAQYAQNHKGVCLELSGPKLQDAMQKMAGERFLAHGHVSYRTELESMSRGAEAFMIDFDRIKSQGMEEGLRRHLRAHREAFFLTKARDWETETEFRWLVNAQEGPFFAGIGEALTAVIVGMDFPGVYEPSLARLCENRDIRLDRLIWHNRHPLRQPLKG